MRAPRFPLTVFYDGACIVCATEIEHYLKKDHGGKLLAVDISSHDFDPAPYKISMTDFMQQLHAIDQDSQVFKGIDSFWAIWQAFPPSTIYGVMGRIIQSPLVNRLAASATGCLPAFDRICQNGISVTAEPAVFTRKGKHSLQ